MVVAAGRGGEFFGEMRSAERLRDRESIKDIKLSLNVTEANKDYASVTANPVVAFC
ncbi:MULTISPECIES: hypothetical protein [Hansschlegelia]|uniref:hypothetical protein n=1 Tax=Hansschlegelia TaxID=444599 RepID=UPI0013E8EAE8|nr:hypothetical protein [Hansschlegelia zhihuaiae]